MKVIVIEGINGAGKSSVAAFVKSALRTARIPCLVADPAAFGLVGQLLRRQIVQATFDQNADLDAVLFAALRTEGVRQIIKEVGADSATIVLLERWSLALAAYGAADGARRQLISELRTVLQEAITVDLTVLLDINGYIASDRLASVRESNRFEMRGPVYLDDVARFYRHFARQEARTEIIDGAGELARVGERLLGAIASISGDLLPREEV
jgi:dTMP kinase